MRVATSTPAAYPYEIIVAADGDDGTREIGRRAGGGGPAPVGVLGSPPARRQGPRHPHGRGAGARAGRRFRGRRRQDADRRAGQAAAVAGAGLRRRHRLARLAESRVEVAQRCYRRLGSRAFGVVHARSDRSPARAGHAVRLQVLPRRRWPATSSRASASTGTCSTSRSCTWPRGAATASRRSGVRWRDDGDSRLDLVAGNGGTWSTSSASASARYPDPRRRRGRGRARAVRSWRQESHRVQASGARGSRGRLRPVRRGARHAPFTRRHGLNVVRCRAAASSTSTPRVVADARHRHYNSGESSRIEYYRDVEVADRRSFAEILDRRGADGARQGRAPRHRSLRRHAAWSQARERGWRVAGIEINAEAARHCREARGLDVIAGTLEPETYPEDSFDVVLMGDVIEHVASPTHMLRTVARILRPRRRGPDLHARHRRRGRRACSR